VEFSLEVPSRPFNGGHVIVRSQKSVFALKEEELINLKKVIDTLIIVEKYKLKPEGFNIYISEDVVHLVPRWCGDINVAFFGDIKVIPLSRDDVEKLIKEVKEQLAL